MSRSIRGLSDKEDPVFLVILARQSQESREGDTGARQPGAGGDRASQSEEEGSKNPP